MKLPQDTFYRNGTVEVRGEGEDRTVHLAFSSEARVERSFGVEVLGHTPEEADFEFINSGRAPLLLGHNHDAHIGVVLEAGIDSDKVGRASVKFSKKALAEEALTDVEDGVLANVSVGYRITDMKMVDKNKRGLETYRVSWAPTEVSLVSVPADTTVGVGRSINHPDIEEKEMSDVIEKKEAPAVDVEAVRADAAAAARKEENARVREVLALGAKFGKADLADSFVQEGKSVEDFRSAILDDMGEARAIDTTLSAPAEIGMDEKEVKQYSIARALRAQAFGQQEPRFIKEAAFEIEASRAAADASGKQPQGILVPYDVLQRDLNVGTATAGGNLVATDLLSGSFIDLLRNASVLPQVGAQYLSGLVGNLAIPRQTGGATAYWVAEGGAPTESQQTIGQVTLTPRTVAAYTEFTRKLLQQSSLDVESFIQQDLAKTLGLAIDLAALYGSGASGEPTGVANVTGINASTFAAAAPTYAEVVAMETAVAADNADVGSLAYVTDTTIRGALKTAEKAANTAQFIWSEGNTLNGYKTAVSNQVTAGDIFFGNFADLVIGLWGGLDLQVNPYSLDTTGAVRITAFQDVDVAVRNPVSFCHSNDTV